MSDIQPNVVVSMPSQTFSAASSFKALANGRIYIGKINTDPTVPQNQIQVYLENESGEYIPVPQPVIINGGGFPVYNGKVSKFVTVEGHSMVVTDAYGAQNFYFPNVLKYDPDQGITKLKNALANATRTIPGTDLIGVPTGDTLTSYLATGRGIDPRMPPYNYDPKDTLINRTAAVQAAFEDANKTKKSVFMSGFFEVDKITLLNHKDYSVIGFGGFISKNTNGYAIEMRSCFNVNVAPGISINANRTVAVKVWGRTSEGGTSLLNLGFTIVGASRAWEFGDSSEPDAQVSEIVVKGGFTLDCGEVFYCYGSQTVIEFNGYQLISGGKDTPNGPSGNIRVGTCVGALVHINGGEVMKTNNSDGGMFVIMPINSPSYDHAFGGVYINGSAIESASPWLVAYNPDKVGSVSAGSGCFVISNCHGYYGSSGIPAQAADGFTGQIRVKNSRFHRINVLNNPIVYAGTQAYPVCDVDDSCFDSYFPKGFNKFNGTCVPLFSYKRIGLVSNLNSQGISGSGNQTDLKFQNIDSSSVADNSYFIDNYSKTSGVFTVPKGGLKNVCLFVQWDVGAAHAGSTLYAMLNITSPGAQVLGDLRLVNGAMQLGNLEEGTAVSLRFQNGGQAFNAYASNQDYLAIYASR